MTSRQDATGAWRLSDAVLGCLLHECVHAYVAMASFDGQVCHPDSDDAEFFTRINDGHKAVWQRIAKVIEDEFNALVGLDDDAGIEAVDLRRRENAQKEYRIHGTRLPEEVLSECWP